MKDKELEEFLEVGWSDGADIYYDGMIYTFNCDYVDDNTCNVNVYTNKVKRRDEKYYSCYLHDNKMIDFKKLIDLNFHTYAEAKEYVLSYPFFNKKSFWKVVDELEWLDDDDNNIIV